MPANIVRGMPEDAYHATRALSAGDGWTLANECPAKFLYLSPWNPDRPVENRKEFDIGTAAHLLLLEPDRFAERILPIDAKDYRTKAAQEARDEAHIAGRVPLLGKHLDQVLRMSEAVRRDPWAADLLDGAETEISFFWDAEGVPCKARADLISRDRAVQADIKTCDSANPAAFQRTAWNLGYFMRAAWYVDGWEEAAGTTVLDYWFIVVERAEPHVVTICRLDTRAMEWGRLMCRRARGLFRECMRSGQWPGYCREPATLTLPVWAEHQLADREQEGAFSADDFRRSSEFLAP